MALCVLVSCLPFSAQADCVTAADLERGIRLESTEGRVGEFRSYSAQAVAFFEMEGDAEVMRVLMLRGLYVTEVQPFANGAPDETWREVVLYVPGADWMPEPAAGAHLTVDASHFSGGQLETLSHRYAFGPEMKLNVSGCSYAAVTVEATYADDPWIQRFAYLTDVGIAVPIGGRQDDLVVEDPLIKLVRAK